MLPMQKLIFNYSQQVQEHSQPVPVHSSPQEHASSQAPTEQQEEVLQAPLQLLELLLLFKAYNTLEPAITTKVANKITFFFMIYFF